MSEDSSYDRVDAAIAFLVANYQDQPALDEAAAAAGLSPHHFQRVFKAWTGVSPKRFLQYVTLAQAKHLLARQCSVFDAALDAGLSGGGRLHDLFVAAEAVTPGEFKARGQGLTIRWGLHSSPFGRALIGVTERGVCWLGFAMETGDESIAAEFAGDWPQARLVHDPAGTAEVAAHIFAFAQGRAPGAGLRLHLRGTNFQLKVWDALLRIPPGRVVSYQDVARATGEAKAARAVGRAVGANPVSLIIPCHRVLLKSGIVHNYRWGTARKRTILALESAWAAES